MKCRIERDDNSKSSTEMFIYSVTMFWSGLGWDEMITLHQPAVYCPTSKTIFHFPKWMD